MNIQIDDREFKPDLREGVPTPNPRQAHKLGEMINRLLANVVKDLDTDPDDYLPRFEAFAGTLKGASASKVLAIGSRDLAVILFSRKRAQRYVDQIADAEIQAALDDRYGNTFTYPIEYERARLLECATGVSEMWGYEYKYRSHNPYGKQSDLHNVLFKNAQEFGKAQSAYQFVEPKESELPSPIPEDMIDRYNKLPGYNIRREAVKEARSNFSSAYWQAKQNLVVADQLFAERFRLMWEIVDAEAEHKRLESKLTKPLEEYASHWEGWSKAGHFEYKHKGAEATRQANNRTENLNRLYDENEERINQPGWSISTLVREAWDLLAIFNLIIEDDVKKQEVKTLADKKKQAAREKRLRERQKLAETPIEVPAVLNEDGLWLDHRGLIEGLVGRTNVTKAYGRSYLKIKGVVVETTKLKQWLTMVLQDPNTNKRIPKTKWQQVQWALVGVGQAKTRLRYDSKTKVPCLYFLAQVGSMRLTTRFYDQSGELEGYNAHNQEPVINTVKPVEVKATIPEHRDVWTPEDINIYRPVLVPAQEATW